MKLLNVLLCFDAVAIGALAVTMTYYYAARIYYGIWQSHFIDWMEKQFTHKEKQE